MDKQDYMKSVNSMKQDGRRNNLISYIVLGIFVAPFSVAFIYLLMYMITSNVRLSVVVGIVVSFIILIVLYNISNKKFDQNVMDIYAKEIPIECQSCGASFTVIAGNAEACPYCGANVLVNNQGHIVHRD